MARLRKFVSKNYLLFLSFLFLGCAIFLWLGLTTGRKNGNDSSYLETVSDNIQNELETVEDETHELLKILQESERPTFTNLSFPSRYPYFVYRNRSLFYWSTNSFLPKQELLSPFKDLQVINQKTGKYIASHHSIRKRGDLFEIYFLIPLSYDYPVSNDYLESGLNDDIFGGSEVSIQTFPTNDGGNLFTADGQYLFSISIPEGAVDPFNFFHEIVFMLSMAGIFLLIGYLINISLFISERKGHGPALVFLFITLALLRGVMLMLDYPFRVLESDLFNAKYFASSFLSPSIGDFLLNVVFGLIFSLVLLKRYSRLKIIRRILVAVKHKNVISFVLLSLNFFLFYYMFDLLLILFSHSQWEVDITESIDVSFFRIISASVFILLFIVFLIYTYIFSKLFLLLNKRRSKSGFYIFLFSITLLTLVVVLLKIFSWQIILADLLFYVIILNQRIPSIYLFPRYKSYLYLLLSAIFFSIIAAYAIYVLKFRNDTINKEKFASQLLIENDVLGEYLLNEALHYIKNDQFIQSVLLNPFAAKEVIEQKIKRVYLGSYFEKYDVSAYVFDATGNSFNYNQEFNYWPDVIHNFKQTQFRTDYPNIVLMYDPGNQDFRRYLSFVKIRKGGAVIGYILVELKQKRVVPHSVYPELLVDEKFNLPYENKNYSYVIYGQNGLVNSYGSFNYDEYFSSASIKKYPDLFDKGIIKNGYHHIAMKGTEGKLVIVSSPEYSWERFFSNFSFSFILLMFCVLLFFLLWSLSFNYKSININFSAKIQIYLNLAFFLPLFIVCITTLSIISSSYKDNLNLSFIKKAESVSNTVNLYLESEQGAISTEKLEDILVEKSRFLETDINLFDNKGKLVFSNQPMIYDAGLFARVVNPDAYARIEDFKSNIFMLPEKVSSFRYNSVYIAVKSYGTGNLLGILSIPFFESKQEVDKQLIEVLTTILNIFVSIFLVFLLLSYLVSKYLTVPLDLITQKLRRTNLSTTNEPIEWSSKDEIGMLVGEYNKMLLKLEESKDALSKSEKESAWREMAQQVAHEIKNPLTPMKLSIQHLQRVLKDRRENINEMFGKSLPVLLEQVNTLSEIATSFSAFAKMPIPKNEKFELVSVFNNITRLHSADQNVEMKIQSPDELLFIYGDQQLLGNIISNLIINAIQSVPAGRNPEISAILQKNDRQVLIRIVDNGTGIPEEIREKVFLPNFSTKFSGSGLGLALAKRGVENAGGKIWFETMEGTGTTFFIELPLAG